MADRILLAKRINNGQSELWFSNEPKDLRVVATNIIVYPVRRCAGVHRRKTD
jgi:hypothetical protein